MWPLPQPATATSFLTQALSPLNFLRWGGQCHPWRSTVNTDHAPSGPFLGRTPLMPQRPHEARIALPILQMGKPRLYAVSA